jgi:hypothetical protein
MLMRVTMENASQVNIAAKVSELFELCHQAATCFSCAPKAARPESCCCAKAAYPDPAVV